MQPLIEEIIEMAKAKDEDGRENAILLIEFIANLQYALDSYDYRIEFYNHIPERYLSIYLFRDEWSKIAHFLSRLFIEDYSEATHRVVYCLKLLGTDALEPLLDILIEAPEKLDREPMTFNRGVYDVSQTLFELMVDGRYKSRRELVERASGKELTRLLKDTSLLPFLTKLSESDLAGKPNKKKLKKMLLWAESELMWKPTKKDLKKLLKSKSPVPFFKRWAASDDPNTAEAGLSWLKRLKEDYGIIK